MFVNFDEIFHPTEDQRQAQINHINNIVKESVQKHGECCCNCKYYKEVNCGHGWMYAKCSKTRKWIEEDIKCEYYEFCGFIGGEII